MRAACHGGGSDTSVAVSTERAQTESTNPEALFVRLVDARGTLRAVPAMTETTPARPDHSTPSPILTLEDGGVVGGGMLAGTALLAVAPRSRHVASDLVRTQPPGSCGLAPPVGPTRQPDDRPRLSGAAPQVLVNRCDESLRSGEQLFDLGRRRFDVIALVVAGPTEQLP